MRRSRPRPPRAPRAPVRAATSPGSISKTSPASSCNMCRIAAPRRRMNDLVAGQIDIIVDQTSNSISQLRAGTIAPTLSRTTACRNGTGYSDHGRSGPAGIPHDVVVRPVGAEGHAEGRHRELNAAAVDAHERPGACASRWKPGTGSARPKDQLTPKRSAPGRRPKSRSGGRCSRLPTSRSSSNQGGCPATRA